MTHHYKKKLSVIDVLALVISLWAFVLSGYVVTHPQVGPRGYQGVAGYGFPGRDGHDGADGHDGVQGPRGFTGKPGEVVHRTVTVFRPARANRQCWVPGYPFWTLRPCSVQ